MAETPHDGAAIGSVNDVVAHSLLSYVEDAVGRAGLAQLVERMPGASNVEELMRGSGWWHPQEFDQLLAVATPITGETRYGLGRRVGEQMLRNLLVGPLGDAIKAVGSTEAACVTMADYSTRMTDGRALSVTETSPTHVLIEGHFEANYPATDFACGFTAGYFSSLPLLFDQLGTCVETTCQNRGDDRCRYRVSWRPDPSRGAGHTDSERITFGASGIDELERTHWLAARLVESEQIDEVLERVIGSVSGAIGAPPPFSFGPARRWRRTSRPSRRIRSPRRSRSDGRADRSG